MTTAYTSLLGFALPVEGELDGTWGDVVNNSITQLCEDSIAGVATQSVAGGNWTLTTTGSGAANQARMAILIPTGSPGVSRNIVAPSQSKAYIVVNQSDASVVIKGSATTGVTIGAGEKALVAWNGSDFVYIGGTVVGPSSATDNAIARYDGTTGKLIQNSAVTIADTTGSMTFTGTAARIIGDLSNATRANRLIFQTSTTDGDSEIYAMPNGTGINSAWSASNGTDPDNSSYVSIEATSSYTRLNSSKRGTGTYLPLRVYTSGLSRVEVDASGNTAFNNGIREKVYAVVDAAGVALSPNNGTIQTWTLGASRTPTAGTWNEGESMTLMVADGTAYTVTWTTLGVVWVGGTAPTLATSGYSVIELWKVGSTIYGAYVGDVA